MALGDLVRSIFVRISEQGADEVKAAIDDVAARAKALSAMDATVHVGVDTSGFAALRAMRTELAALTASGDRGGLGGLAVRLKQFGEQTDSGRLKTAALALELRALQGAAANAAGAVGTGVAGGGLTGALGSLGALIGVGGAGGTSTGSVAGSAGGIVAIIAALGTGIQGIIPDLAAAAAGVGAFGALAYPIFSDVFKAVGTLATDTAAYKVAIGDLAKDQALKQIRADWAALSPAQQQAVKGVQALQAEFGKMVTAFEPVVMPIFNQLLQLADKVMPDLAILARAAAPAIASLVQGFARFAESAGFKQFIEQLARLSGPAIATFGTALGRITIALGRFMMALANPDALRIFKGITDGIAYAITGAAIAVQRGTQLIIGWYHDIAVRFDQLRNQFAYDAHEMAHNFDNVRGAIAFTGSFIAHFFTVDIPHWVSIGHAWFMKLPGLISQALTSLPSILFQAGKNAVQGLINGLLSMLGSLGSAVAQIASKVAGFFGLSPAVEGPLSGPGAPFIRGQHFAGDLIAGINSRQGALGAATAGLARAAAMGGYPGGGYGWGGQLVIEIHPPAGSAVLGAEFFTALAHGIRTRGGDPAIIQRKVVFR